MCVPIYHLTHLFLFQWRVCSHTTVFSVLHGNAIHLLPLLNLWNNYKESKSKDHVLTMVTGYVKCIAHHLAIPWEYPCQVHNINEVAYYLFSSHPSIRIQLSWFDEGIVHASTSLDLQREAPNFIIGDEPRAEQIIRMEQIKSEEKYHVIISFRNFP